MTETLFIIALFIFMVPFVIVVGALTILWLFTKGDANDR